MADIYGSYFTYDGKSSSAYDLIMVNIDTDRYLKLSSETESITFLNKAENKKYLIGDSIDEDLISFEVEIITYDNKPLSYKETRDISKWLFKSNKYSRLYIDDEPCSGSNMSEVIDGETKRLYLNCRFINPEKIEYDGVIIGYKATLEADSNLLWQDEITKKFTFNTTGSNTINIKTDTDVNDYIYPTVKFHVGSEGGTLYIINDTDNNLRQTKIEDVAPNAIFTMRGGGLNYMTGGYYEKMTNQNFIRLLDGNNTIRLGGDIKACEFTFQNRRMM